MPEAPLNKRAAKWAPEKRYRAAVEKILDEGWKVTDAAREYGVGRKALYKRLREERISRGMEPTAAEQRRVDAERRERMRAIPEAHMENDEAPAAFAADAEIRARLPFDPAEFNRTYFGHFVCPDCKERHPSPPFHEEILGICQDPGIKRGLILTPPYHAKTTVANVRDTIYDLVHDRNHRTIIISESKPFAELIVGQISELLRDRSMYDGAERNLIDDFGPFHLQGNTWNSESLVIVGRSASEKDPNVQALGWTSQIYGRRADKIKTDDLATQKNQNNVETVEKMVRWIDSEVLSRIGRNSRFIMIGTRVLPGDVYSSYLDRPGWHVVRYPAILDESTREMLWPEHFPYEEAELRRSEYSDPAMFQLVYQNVDSLSHGAAFNPEDIEACLDVNRQIGHFESQWFMIAGLDPAGAGKESGYTAMVLVAVDASTGQRYLIDAYRQKQMRAPEIRDKMMDWSDRYPIYEWRVEMNGLQRQLFQYNDDIIRPLAARGIRVAEHVTNQNKWDPQFGVESMAPLFASRMVSIPIHQPATDMGVLLKELKNFPYLQPQDLAMAMWFAEIGCREIVQRPSLPLFSERTQKWPERIRKRRHMVDFSSGEVFPIALHMQRSRFHNRASRRRMIVGRPTLYPNLVEGEDPRMVPFMNREGFVQVDDAPEGAEDLMSGWDAQHQESDLTRGWNDDGDRTP